jgi:hypothetical protein
VISALKTESVNHAKKKGPKMKKKLKQLNQESKTQTPMKKDPRWALRFSPTAWAKLLYFRDKSENEVGGFGITAQDDLLFIQDLVTVKQKVTFASVQFEDEAVANFFEDQVDYGRQPQQFARIWVHCHPGDCPKPSMTDEETFQRVFGGCDFAIMCIVAQGNQSYARISFNVGPGGQVLIPVEVDYSEPFEGSNRKRWDQEFKENVHEEVFQRTARGSQQDIFGNDMLSYDIMEELDQMDEHERQQYLDELALDPDSYDREEVLFL